MKITIGRILSKVVLSVIVAFLLFISLGPIIWLYLSSFKPTGEIFINPWGWPKNFAWVNYSSAWTRGGIGDYFVNSIIISVFSVAIMVFIGSMAGFAISKYYRLKSSYFVLLYFLLGQMIPAQVVLIPLYIILSKIGLLSTYTGLILVYCGTGLPFVILVMQGFFRTIQRELYEAATIDGYNLFQIFLKIALPLARPAIATTLIIQFLFVWNEFVLAVVMNNKPERMTLPVGIYRAVIDQYSTDYGVAFASICITIIPMIIVYAVFQRHILGGITAGALKG